MEENITLILGLYAAGLVVSGLLFAYRLGKAGEKRLCALIGMILGLPLAYAGAKLFFLLHNLGADFRNWSADMLLPHWEEMSFTGGCIGFTLGVWIAARIMRVSGRKKKAFLRRSRRGFHLSGRIPKMAYSMALRSSSAQSLAICSGSSSSSTRR